MSRLARLGRSLINRRVRSQRLADRTPFPMSTPVLRPQAMTTVVFRLKAPRPTFALDMTAEEQEVMGRRAAC
jgi:hypothetical protein